MLSKKGLSVSTNSDSVLDGVEARLRFVAVEQRRRRHTAIDQAEHRAVLGRDVGEEVGGADAATADDVLHHDGWVAVFRLKSMSRMPASIRTDSKQSDRQISRTRDFAIFGVH
jgi:hypothetical protein